MPEAVLREIAGAFTRIPEGFHPHPKVLRTMEAREAMVAGGGDIDWGCGEALAFGSLVLEGTEVRLSGQDTRRGTFSHRHAVLHDIEDDARWVPLAHVRAGQAPFVIIDSMLSENACLGFEFGFSTADPTKLVVWEAQFGDFANGAQVIIDQFIASSESKWQRMSGLVLLLPHGYEGQGPEHSSARLERYLQLCAENNMQVCNFTTPAQYFHALRRQMHRTFRKPLIVMSPKSLLRHKLAVSSLRDLTEGRFEPVLDDGAPAGGAEDEITLERTGVRRVVLLQREDLLRAARGPPRAQHRQHGDRAGGAALSVPPPRARGGAGRLPAGGAGVLGAGGAGEHGSMAVHRSPATTAARRAHARRTWVATPLPARRAGRTRCTRPRRPSW